MKKIFRSLGLFLALTFSVPNLLLVAPTAVLYLTATGCKTANQTAYKATSATYITVDAAMKAWGDFVRANHPPVEKEQKVKAAFDRYQAAALVVTSAGAAHAKVLADQAADPATKATALSNLNAAIAVTSASLADLINLVQVFGAKL